MKSNILLIVKDKMPAMIMKHKIVLLVAAIFLVCGIKLGQSTDEVHSDITIHNEKDGQEEHGESEDAHAHEGIIKLKDSTIKQFGIELARAGAGKIGIHTMLPAEIALNGDRKAHVVPRIPGVVRSVIKTLGDKVRAGEVLAVIHSRELADYKAGYLGAREKIALAETMFEREKNLWEKKITAEQEYLNAKRDLADAQNRTALCRAETSCTWDFHKSI